MNRNLVWFRDQAITATKIKKLAADEYLISNKPFSKKSANPGLSQVLTEIRRLRLQTEPQLAGDPTRFDVGSGTFEVTEYEANIEDCRQADEGEDVSATVLSKATIEQLTEEGDITPQINPRNIKRGSLRVTINFTPKRDSIVDEDQVRIALVQTSRPIRIEDNKVTFMSSGERQLNRMTQDTAMGYYLDRRCTAENPIYGALDLADDTSTLMASLSTGACEIAYGEALASLNDMPCRYVPAHGTISHEFETAAIEIREREGKISMRHLGSLTWGYKIVRGVISPLKLGTFKPGKVTPQFLEAMERWNDQAALRRNPNTNITL
ncbi:MULTISPECIES: hypothetical protein [unclassified Vibrio]|uniref:hypothetical protein n=1 Tax=unclassified Vibrio TaxID=2614977 RepID=UPI0012693C37|nr:MULTISPECIES: hypothetical protein [unclassified Vibrio]QFT39832.1 hypothetical protein FIU99_25945 [Vibrio sp. THAF64]QGM37661.1 hypothetical protein GGC04_25535 [Vibrio sp. THAF191d]QGN73382.1 hypothetical protein GGC03_26710 [Vibrio sp. THAF191c]